MGFVSTTVTDRKSCIRGIRVCCGGSLWLVQGAVLMRPLNLRHMKQAQPAPLVTATLVMASLPGCRRRAQPRCPTRDKRFQAALRTKPAHPTAIQPFPLPLLSPSQLAGVSSHFDSRRLLLSIARTVRRSFSVRSACNDLGRSGTGGEPSCSATRPNRQGPDSSWRIVRSIVAQTRRDGTIQVPLQPR